MVLFMGKMAFTLWSKEDQDQNSRSEVTYMDREVAGNFFDYMRPDRRFQFSNYEHNNPDPEYSVHGSDSTSQLDDLSR